MINHYFGDLHPINMKSFTALIFVIISVLAHSKADELDDLRASAVENLGVLAQNADRKIGSNMLSIGDMKLYIDHAEEVFLTTNTNGADADKATITTSADELTAKAIENNKPAKVIQCIANERDNGYVQIDKILNTATSKISDAAVKNTADFDQQVATIQLIKNQIPTLLATATNNVNTCVVPDCFNNNLGIASTQFDNAVNNSKQILDQCTGERKKFDQTSSDAIAQFREDKASALEKALKAMGKC